VRLLLLLLLLLLLHGHIPQPSARGVLELQQGADNAVGCVAAFETSRQHRGG
jgi:hypothetical protein